MVESRGLKQKIYDLYVHGHMLVNHNTITKEVNGVSATFNTETRVDFTHYRAVPHQEKVILTDLWESTTSNDVFYDIGANIGIYSCFVGQKARHTVAIEPYPENMRLLKRNCETNQIPYSAHQLAVSDHCGTESFRVDARQTAGSGEGSITDQSDAGTIEVQVTTVDKLGSDFSVPAPDIIKVDVEGHEAAVLDGMTGVLGAQCRLVYMEIHGNRLPTNQSPSKVKDNLVDAGFSIETLESNMTRENRPNVEFVRAEK